MIHLFFILHLYTCNEYPGCQETAKQGPFYDLVECETAGKDWQKSPDDYNFSPYDHAYTCSGTRLFVPLKKVQH